ncbi:MAG: hypothetical protein ABFS05_06210 [Bacteroidota bacterium]
MHKKFGAFSGVFTPSILTILGVIMYMRLGWVVGQAGLITAIGIIVLAHVISITTGLSISSIATDKKIKTGGIYYMLSRSLGLPMGGSIGLTMFVGTALSISLYIIGFCENFLGIEIIREITGLGNTIQDFRILGSVMLGILVIIAFISTSIAIKTQFFILGAIVLSLVSIGIGLFTGDTSTAKDISWLPVADGVSITTVFAIFFPAVTGFTAGVAMSGDLKNPQKNIPFGTLASIVTGFIVYIGLAIGFALLVDRQLLLGDNNFLMKIAWSSPLVVAGIWGATLSSALGGILGGPRILQAMSRDKITPKVFGKGYGINNEPRNALLFTFLIAESGILIGELDVIAAIVSMFYIAAYGFINLAFALERWASADFRPSFRISKWVGIIGFAACFGVMFKLDTPVMFLSMFILAGIYFYIRRKKLELDFGDVWQSVWSSIARAILHRIDRKGLEERNWRPNIVLFSGGSKNRPHLIQFGKDLVGNQGFLSNFDLILNKSSSVLFKKHQQSVADEFSKENEGVFTRKQECQDIYEGIEAISSTYGFSGVEPNTVLFGWARQSQDPVRFAKMIRSLGELDLNILMMDYDKDAGFGKKKIIDVWCRGGGNNCNLVLSLIKFMWLSDNWKDARIRILMVNPINDEKELLIKDVEHVLESVRMDAEIKIINNQIEKRPINELIEVESSNSDIVFLGIPQIRAGEEDTYVKQVNRLCQNVGTVVLVKASSYFKDFEIGHSSGLVKHDKSEYTEDDVDLVISRKIKIPEIYFPADPESQTQLKLIFDTVKNMNDEAFNNQIVDLFSLNRSVYADIVNTSNSSLEKLKNKIESISGTEDWKANISETYRDIFHDTLTILDQQEKNTFTEQQHILQNIITHFSESCATVILQSPEIFYKSIRKEDLRFRRGDGFRSIWFKVRKRIFYGSFKAARKQKLRFRRLVASHFKNQVHATLTEVFQNWGMISIQQVIKTQELNNKIFDTFFLLNKVDAKKETAQLIDKKMMTCREKREQIDKLNEASLQTFYTLLMNKTFYIIRQIGKELQEADTKAFIQRNEKLAAEQEKQADMFFKVPDKWKHNQVLLNNFSLLELMLFTYITQAKDALHILHFSLEKLINHSFISDLQKIEAACHHSTQILYDTLQDVSSRIDQEAFEEQWDHHLEEALNALHKHAGEVRNKIELMDRATYDNFKLEQYEDHRSMTLRSKKLVEYILQHEFIIPLQSVVSETRDWMLREMQETFELIEKHISIVEMLKNDKSKSSDLPQLREAVSLFSQQLREVEKNELRMLNQIQERINALADKFSLNTITRRTGFLRKFIR